MYLSLVRAPPTESSILQQYELRKRFWRPWNLRQEFWHLMYLLFDAHQAAKPPGRMQFVTNEPANLVDKGSAAIARNNIRLSMPIDNVNNEYERDMIARAEDIGYGIFDEIDESLARRGYSGTLRDISAKSALIRGAICSRLILQSNSEHGFVDYDDWDTRFTYPTFAKFGMRDVLNFSEEPLGRMLDDHPDLSELFTGDDDYTQPVQKFIWYDEDWYGCVAYLPRRREGRQQSSIANMMWLSQDPDTGMYGPYRHGLPDIPVAFTPVNGLPFRWAPGMGLNTAFNTIQAQQDLRWTEGRNVVNEHYRMGPNHWTADFGRSLFATTEKTFKQFNELVSTVWQVVNNEAYGTWVLRTKDGRLVNVELGNNVVNYLRLDEVLEKIQPHIAPPSITDLLSLSSREIERGTFSFKLFGDQFEGSGFLFNQVQQGLANALHPYSQGVERHFERLARIGIRQFRLGDFNNITVYGQRPQSRQIFSVEVSSSDIERDYRIKCQLQLSVPEDMLSKIQMARLLADPRRPLASLQTIFDKILLWDDPDGEKRKIFEDIADTDPIIVLERVARALEQRGLDELAQTIRQKEFMLKAAQELQAAQISGQAQQLLGQGGGAGSESGGQSVSPPNPTATGQPAPDATATAGGTY